MFCIPPTLPFHILYTVPYLTDRTLPFVLLCFVGNCGDHLSCNTCCEHMHHTNIELALLGDNARNGLVICNLIHISTGILEYKFNLNIQFCSFSSKIVFIQMIEICIKV